MSGKRPKNPPDRFSPPLKKPARRGRPRRNDEEDEDEDDEAQLQTQMPMTPPRPDPPAYATRRTPAPASATRTTSTSKKAAASLPPSAISKGNTPSLTSTSASKKVAVAESEEKDSEEEAVQQVPEVKEEEDERKVAIGRVKNADIVLNQYYYDIIDMEQHCVLFERSARTERWNVLQVRASLFYAYYFDIRCLLYFCKPRSFRFFSTSGVPIRTRIKISADSSFARDSAAC